MLVRPEVVCSVMSIQQLLLLLIFNLVLISEFDLRVFFFNQELRTYQWNCQFRQENGGYLSKGWLNECLIGGQLISGPFRVGLAAQVEELSPIGALIHTADVVITYKDGVFFPQKEQIPCKQ